MSATDSDFGSKSGRHRPESVADMLRIRWPTSFGITGRHGPDYAQERLELFSGVSSFFQVERDISAYLYLGRAAISQGDLSQAEKLLKKAGVSDLWNSPDFGWRLKVELLLAWIALLNQQGEHAHAARLIGSVDSLYRRTELRYSPRERSEHAEALAASRAALGEQAFAAAFATGQALTLNQALESVQAEKGKSLL